MREEQVVLKDHPDFPSFGRYVNPLKWIVKRVAVQRDLALVYWKEPGQGRHCGGLARPVGSQQGDGPTRQVLRASTRDGTNPGGPRGLPPDHPVGSERVPPLLAQGDENRQRHHHHDQADRDRGVTVALQRNEYRQRQRLGPALQVAGEGDGCAELAERPCQVSTSPAMSDGATMGRVTLASPSICLPRGSPPLPHSDIHAPQRPLQRQNQKGHGDEGGSDDHSYPDGEREDEPARLVDGTTHQSPPSKPRRGAPPRPPQGATQAEG